MNKIPLVASVAFGLIYPILAAEIYVDSASSAQSPDGSVDSPYKTIAAAVNAANSIYELKETSVINIKGGEYVIAAAEDLISVTASNLTIQAWDGTGTPKIVLDSELSVQSENPSIITVQSTALDCTIKGLEFQYFINNTRSRSGNSLGEKGRIIDVYAGRCSVDGCKFRQNDTSTVAWGLHNDGIVSSRGEEGNHKVVGYELCVKNCYFSKVGRHNGRAIRSGTDAKIISNIFDDCAGYFYPIKQSIGGHFISNRVVNARASIFSNGQNYNEYNNMEIAYNIFVNATSEPFFQKSSAGMSSVKIHHNTIVGGRAFVATCNANKFLWTPSFYNNLIILPDSEDVVIAEEGANVGDVNPTTFKKGSVFKDNVWLARDFNGGSAPLNLSQYKLIADSVDSVGLYVDNNRQISIAPEFIETEDVFSDDFYRLNLTRYPWAAGLNSSQDTIPVYVGAMEPVEIDGEPGEFFSIDSFTVEGESIAPLVEQTFAVRYSHNAGDVTVSFDFQGDGVYDYTGSDRDVKHAYPVAGDYFPVVKIVDAATGRELIAKLTVPLFKVRRLVSYVDSMAEEGGDGTEESPYKSIKKALSTADNNATVFVRGGAGRVYEINSEEDLISISQYRLTIKSVEEYDNACIVVSHMLSASVSNPNVITIEKDAFEVTISDLDFVWYGELNETYPGNSLGNEGRIIDVYGDRATIRNCNFRLDGDYKKSMKSFAIRAHATQGGSQPGAYMRIDGCVFEGNTKNGKYMNGIFAGNFPTIIQNVFTNCDYVFTALKEGRDMVTFSSNTLYECSSIRTKNEVYGGSAEMPNAEISYNKFITNSGNPFIIKGDYGLNGDSCRLHHNTVVGASAFMSVEIAGKNRNLEPQIYDNLILLAPGGLVIADKSTAIPEGMTSAFKSETSFSNNVYLASAFSGGTATELSGYKMNVEPVNCTVLSSAPRFISTDSASPDFMRLKSKKTDWPYASSSGGYPNYVGAQEPMLRLDGMRIIIR